MSTDRSVRLHGYFDLYSTNKSLCVFCQVFTGGSSRRFHSAPNINTNQQSSDLSGNIVDHSEQTRGCLKPGARGRCVSEFAGMNKLPPRFGCPICARTFTRRGGLTQHVKHIHDKNSRYKCESCGKGFCVRLDYFDHVAAHTGVKRNLCIVCKKRFTYSRDLRAHVSRCHPTFK